MLLVNMGGAIAGGISVNAVRVRSCLCYTYLSAPVSVQGSAASVINVPGETKWPHGGISNVWWFGY